MKNVFTWSILLLSLLSLSSCGKRFYIEEYQFNVVSVKPGYWDNGAITRYPSVDVRVEGPDTHDWEIIISPANGATPYSESVVTGQLRTITLEGIGLSADLREIGLTIQAVHVGTGQTLASYRQYKATLEGNFTPPETIHVTSLSMTVDEESSSLTITDGHRAAMDVMPYVSGSLTLSYTKDATETGAISCKVSQTDGKHLTLSQDGIVPGESSFTIPFTAAEAGTGSFSVTLKGNGPETVLVISYVVKSSPYEATFTPRHFTFADQIDAHGTVDIFGFKEGEKCDVIVYWKETTSGNEGSTPYKGVDAKAPLDVVLWKAGEATVGQQYVFWAEVFQEGKTQIAAKTKEQSVSPFALKFVWTDARGNSIAADGKVCSWANEVACSLEVQTASWAPEYISKVSVKDNTAGRTYFSQEPVANTDGCYSFEIKEHQTRGVHSISVTLETQEGDYTIETGMTFIDVWTVSPFTTSSSALQAKITGPAASVKTDCTVGFTLYGYAHWDYTVAEKDGNGQQVNTPKEAQKYIGSRTEPFTVEKGTANGSSVRLATSLEFKVAMRMLKDRCSGKPFSESGLTASRWSGSNIENYTPENSKTLVTFSVKADDAFYNDFNDLEIEVSSKLKSTLKDSGILY